MKKLKVGVVGLVHDHVWGEMDKVVATKGMGLVAVADHNLPLLHQAVSRHRGVRAYTNWKRMLDRECIDIGMVAMTNGTTHPVVEELARRRIHIISEKPMSARLWQADRMLKAAKRYGVKLFINWPSAWNPGLYLAARMVKSGVIGQVYMAKWRGGHNGPKEIGCSPYFWKWLYNRKLNGAGALADYAGYGGMVLRTVMGRQPVAVLAVARKLTKKYSVPDDNAVLTLEYPKAFGILEASWSNVAAPPWPYGAFQGTKGALGISGRNVLLWLPGKQVREIKAPPLPAGHRNAAEYMLWAIRNRKRIVGPCSPEVSRDAQEIIEAGIRASASGRKVRLPL